MNIFAAAEFGSKQSKTCVFPAKTPPRMFGHVNWCRVRFVGKYSFGFGTWLPLANFSGFGAGLANFFFGTNSKIVHVAAFECELTSELELLIISKFIIGFSTFHRWVSCVFDCSPVILASRVDLVFSVVLASIFVVHRSSSILDHSFSRGFGVFQY